MGDEHRGDRANKIPNIEKNCRIEYSLQQTHTRRDLRFAESYGGRLGVNSFRSGDIVLKPTKRGTPKVVGW